MSNKNVIEALERLLADSYLLYLKTQNYHWNVTGPMFTSLHTLFENQYSELSEAIDEIAERIRSLGGIAPGSFKQFYELASIQEESKVPKSTEMIQQLISDLEVVHQTSTAVIQAAEEVEDSATADLGVRRIDIQQKAAWMLRSHLED